MSVQENKKDDDWLINVLASLISLTVNVALLNFAYKWYVSGKVYMAIGLLGLLYTDLQMRMSRITDKLNKG